MLASSGSRAGTGVGRSAPRLPRLRPPLQSPNSQRDPRGGCRFSLCRPAQRTSGRAPGGSGHRRRGSAGHSIGTLGIAASLFETFAATGLSIEGLSPLTHSFKISSGNSAEFHLQSPKQHEPGRGETWLATSRVTLQSPVKAQAGLLSHLRQVANCGRSASHSSRVERPAMPEVAMCRPSSRITPFSQLPQGQRSRHPGHSWNGSQR